MSLANLIVQPHRAVLQADAGAFLADGTVVAFVPKLRLFEKAAAAFSWRGGILFDALNYALSRRWKALDSLHALYTGLPDVMREATALTAREQDGTSSCFTMIARCPATARPLGFMMTNDAAWFDGQIEPYKWVRVDNAIGSHEALADIGLNDVADLSNPARFDIDRDSLRLIEAQRRRPWGSWPHHDPHYAVAHRIGGYVDQAEVTAEGVRERRLIRWEQDRLGERIAA